MIESVTMVNWCQYDELVLHFHPGFNALVGPNGAGKSNALAALLFALTGENPLHGVAADNVNRDAAADAPSYVEVALRRNNQPAVVRRDLRPAGRVLTVAGRSCTAAKEVNRGLEDFLGAAGPVLSSYVFVPQWKVFGFVDDRDADRAKSFHKLFGTDKLDRVHQALSAVKISVDSPEIALDDALKQDADTLAGLNAASDEAAALPDVPDDLDGTPQAYVVAQATRRAGLVARLDDLARTAGRLRADVAAAERETAECEAALAAGADPDLAALERQLLAVSRRQRLEHDVREVEDAAAADAEPPAATAPGPDAERDAVRHAAELSVLRRFLSTFADGRAACPTCGTLAAVLAGQLDEAVRRAEELEALVNEFRSRQSAHQLHRAWCDRDRERGRLLASLRRRRDDEPATTMTEGELRRAMKDGRESLAERKRLRDRVDALRSPLSLPLGQLVELERQHAAAAAEVEGLPDDPTAAAARAWLAEARGVQRQRWGLRERTRLLSESLEQNRIRLRGLRAAAAAAGRDRDVLARVDRMKEVFHWNALPRDLAESYLARAVAGANDLLDSFGAKFRVSVGPSLGFTATRGGKPFSACRLSGGEKVIFALAFRVMVNSMFAKDVGLLVLDEPTAGLDEDNVACLDGAFSRLRELSSASGLQVIVVTHEQQLSPLFDRVHELGPPAVAGRREK